MSKLTEGVFINPEKAADLFGHKRNNKNTQVVKHGLFVYLYRFRLYFISRILRELFNTEISRKKMKMISTEYYSRCVKTLEQSYFLLLSAEKESIEYEIYRNSLVKSFEITLEQSGKLLRKKLVYWLPSKKAAYALTFKDVFRHALKHSLLKEEEVERWLTYRDNRNDTAHNYGEHFAEKTVALMKNFIKDAYRLEKVIGG